MKNKKILTPEDIPEFQQSIDNMSEESKAKVDNSMQRCEYELLVEEYYGVKLKKEDKDSYNLVDFACFVHQHYQKETAAALATDKGNYEILFYLAELVRTVSRVSNKFPDSLHEHDLDRLTQAKATLSKYSDIDEMEFPKQSVAAALPVQGALVSIRKEIESCMVNNGENEMDIAYGVCLRIVDKHIAGYNAASLPAK